MAPGGQPTLPLQKWSNCTARSILGHQLAPGGAGHGLPQCASKGEKAGSNYHTRLCACPWLQMTARAPYTCSLMYILSLLLSAGLSKGCHHGRASASAGHGLGGLKNGLAGRVRYGTTVAKVGALGFKPNMMCRAKCWAFTGNISTMGVQPVTPSKCAKNLWMLHLSHQLVAQRRMPFGEPQEGTV